MAKEFTYDVFLSYSNEDKELVHSLARRLRDSGLKVWLDEWCIPSGQDIAMAIHSGLAASRHVVLCLSRAALQSRWVSAEYLTTLFVAPNSEACRFVPVLLEDCFLPPMIQRFKYIDYRDRSESAFASLRKACSPPPESVDLIRPLHAAEDRFLQVLLKEFHLTRHAQSRDGDAQLHIRFDDFTPAIWNSQGRRHLLVSHDAAKRRRYQEELDDFLLAGCGEYWFHDPEFAFRYGSGGTLPILTLTGRGTHGTYLCLIYREVFPIGWNIANGGCDNREELLNPEITIERELREELIIADFDTDTRYVFPADASKPLDHPAHTVARRLWSEKHNIMDLTSLQTRSVEVKWHKGPDHLHVQFGGQEPVKREGFYLNINGEDFGIEVDRVAEIALPDSVILFDGELEGNRLVNCPIGLFEIERFRKQIHEQVRSGKEAAFIPDFFFFDAKLYLGTEFENVLQTEFMQHVRQFLGSDEIGGFAESLSKGQACGLCPVTERLVRRYLGETGPR